MLEFIIGLISGVVSGIGMGGGTILILCLTLFTSLNQHVAQATNLIFFIPTSITAIIVSVREKLIDWNIGIIVAIFGVIGAFIGANISTSLNVFLLKKFFGIFLGFIAIYEICSLIKEYRFNKKTNNKKIID